MSNITFNPMVTTGAGQSFLLETDGFVQGTFFDDPAMRYQLEGGFVARTETAPIWGGLPLSLLVPELGANPLGPSCSIATTTAGINAWCMFNQAAGMIITPSSTVPSASSGMSVNFVRPGSLLRIALPVNPSLVNSLVGGSTTQQVSWDFTNNYITTYNSGIGALPVQIEFVNTNSKVVSYNSSTGAITWNDAGACAIVRI